MRRFFVGSIALAALCSGPALAAELPLKAAPLLFDWTGWYLGGNGGYSEGRSHGDNHAIATAGTTNTFSTRYRGWFGSVEGGYNLQTSDGKVYGLEFRTDFGRECGRTTNDLPDTTDIVYRRSCFDPFLFGPHIGVLTDANHMLWYLTGGLAVGEVQASATASPIAASASANKWDAGWFIGVGIERMIDSHWSWKVEYDYVRLAGGKTGAFSPALVGGTAGIGIGGQSNDNVITVGINYHFTTH